MARRQKRWAFSSTNKAKSRVVESIKIRFKAKADHFIESELKPQHVKPPPQDQSLNYVVDIDSKWHGNYLYFLRKVPLSGAKLLL